MNAHSLRTLLRRHNLLQLTILLLALFAVAFGIASSRAQHQQKEAEAATANERKLKNAVPDHVPVKVRVKNEQALKRLNNKNWARELEVEVKNTGSKPIYFVNVEIVMPEIVINGGQLVMMMAYGRKELVFPDTPVEPSDVPILPSDSITLKIPERRVKGYEKSRDEDKIYSDPVKIEIEVQVIRFGDGTSLIKGVPWQNTPKKKSSNETIPKGSVEGCKPDDTSPSPSGDLIKALYSSQPASLLRANFSLPDKAKPVASLSSDCGCQSGPGCMWGRLSSSSCPCDEQVLAIIPAGGCANNGQCWRYVTNPSC
jgi:hypothetical protein